MLAEETLLSDDFLRQLMSVGEVDLLVGVPSHNNVQTIGTVIATIEESYRQNFTRDRVVILNVDGGSRDGTTEAVLQRVTETHPSLRGITSLRTIHRITTEYPGGPSPGQALRTILEAADLVRAKACAVVSPQAPTLDTAWVKNLLQPSYRDDFDFVAPLYSRHKFEGLLARNLLYPLTRAILGRGIREPHATDFGFSGKLATYCLSQDVWTQDAVRMSPETWMVVSAVTTGLKTCQTFLGPKVQPSAGSGADIVTAIRETVGPLFWALETNQDYWMGPITSQSVPTFGPDHELSTENVRINRKRIYELFQKGVSDLSDILRSILTDETRTEIELVAALDEEHCRVSNELWVRIVYDFASAYHHTVINRDHLLQSLVPLYRGRIFSYLVQHHTSTPDEMEVDTENLCHEFDKQKPYLLEKWKAK
jgi:glucosylglycerate synthase